MFFRLLCLLTASYCLSVACHADEKIRIGAIVSLTGAAAENGKSWLEGAQLAESDLTREGVPTEVVVEDDATKPSNSVSGFLKVVTQDKVDGVVGGTWDFLAESMYPLAERFKIPFITPTNPIEVLSAGALKNRWVFTNGLSVSATVRAVKAFWMSHKPRSVGIIAIQVPYGLVHAARLKEVAAELDVPIEFTKEITFQGFADDIKLAALESKRFNVDVLFVILDRAGNDILVRQLDVLGFGPKIIMTHTLQDAFELSSSKKLYRNALGVFQTINDDNGFVQRFVERYGRAPGDYSANGYDATLCLARAISKKVFAAEMLQFDCRGVTGAHHFTDSSRALVDTNAGVFTISEKGLIPVS